MKRRPEGLPGALLVVRLQPAVEAVRAVPHRPDPTAEAIVPPGVKRTIAPTRSYSRFDVDPSHRGDFLHAWDAKRQDGEA